MADKPKRASEYTGEHLALVRSTCLHVATKLYDFMDEVVVVGGLAPSLLVDQGARPEGASAHVGTMDLDVGLKLALLDEGRYRKLTERLRDASLTPDQTDDGRPTRQRWRTSAPAAGKGHQTRSPALFGRKVGESSAEHAAVEIAGKLGVHEVGQGAPAKPASMTAVKVARFSRIT